MDGLVTYDVLDNERRKAIVELRKVCTELDESVWTWIEDVAIAIGAQDEPNDEYESMLPKITDRLIHLLGGDKPSGIDVLREMDKCEADGRITDELRERITGVCRVSGLSGEKLYGIADRIDAQFDRICQQHEAVLQSTIDGMVKEYEHDRESDQLRIEKLVRQRDAAYACADELSDELLRVRREHDEAREERDRLKRDMLDKWVPRTSYEEKVEKYRRAYMESDAWRKSLQEKLNAMRDAITAALNG